ncbi:beta-galactosidase [Bacillus solitudinis]|uniref:beta-galactosidase n=1 Tax=Bacillus solitudinis TaxID=2014074 RepID=UPI000C2377FF|nr:beta-galactosidase [Bacillus solitudinis]
MGKRLYHGAAYYPELWSNEVLEEDIKLMKEAGINVARMGEFAWATMEPEEGQIDLGFFVNVINRLYEEGIETVMCTPTPTPPIWFTHGHPERMYVDQDGKVMGHGSRQHPCTNNDYFREKAEIITEHIAKAVGQLPGVIGWQIDNEFKCHVSECMCATCKTLWHEWLQERYGTIEHLNDAWGAQIWSERYHSFEQVPQPGPAPFLHNSSLSTMYRLFSMEKIAEFSDSQAEIIRKYSDAPITHNSNIPFAVDNERLFKNLDFASFDTYASQENRASYLMNCDLWRNFKKGKDFWIMETSTSYAASLESYASPHANGYLRAEAVAAYALGAEAFCYWLWRQQRSGCEQPHGSVISSWGKPTVGFQSVLEVENMRKAIEPMIIETRPSEPEVALVYSDRAKVFFQTEPHQNLDYRGLITDFYDRIVSLGIHRDVIPEGDSLEGYKLLITPFVPYISSDFLRKAQSFVEDGGTWIVGPLTGGRTEEHTVHTDAALGQIEKIAGAQALFTYPIDGTGAVGEAFGVSAPLGLWSTIFEYDEKATVGTIKGGNSDGKSFITEHSVGKGKIVMLGSMPVGEEGDNLLKKIIETYAEDVNVSTKTDVTSGTIVAPRRNDNYTAWVIVNMDGKGGSVTLPKDGVDVLKDEAVGKGPLSIGQYEYRVIQFNK